MASALVNSVAFSPSPSPPPPAARTETHSWILGPRISFSHDAAADPSAAMAPADQDGPDSSAEDFEFHLQDDPVSMLPADELFSEGKLVPLQLAAPRSAEARSAVEVGLADPLPKAEIDPYAFSPRAPRCSAGWRELLGLKRARAAKSAGVQVLHGGPVDAAVPRSVIPRSVIKHLLLHRQPKNASIVESMSLPLLRDSDHDSTPVATRLSHSSSSSSGPDHENLARLSIESDKPGPIPPRVRLARRRPAMLASSRDALGPNRRTADPPAQPPRGVSVDSPRMSPSGKIVFQGLERSSSSPGSFTGGPRPRPRGVDRSYSANVRVAPVLNVLPVGSLRGSSKTVSVFGQKKDRYGSASKRAELTRRHRRQDRDRHASPKIN
ncbi:uncharacterized protein LOC122007265 [Zingiber officinale]|uniref:Uncharacterized protein n=1 Tax=Zingiber officinale TaxID=94328 RepID=A0A8J5G4F2_ZINOF|nr:uncharacterized protein LOC122007265 [Zingiber officinale]XP_042419033.1 uncharacterized protein LOC122007265 [Zingiber officinale]KAG6491364.1 hypothetical protein ZIOFF_052704 [Zingiber officinale]